MPALLESAIARRLFSVQSSSFVATVLGLSLILCGRPASAYGQTTPVSTELKTVSPPSAGGSALPPHQATHADTGVPSSTDAAARTAPKGVNQGILVSGYWKIDVRNPDGSLAKHVEFENSLTDAGTLRWLPMALFGDTKYETVAGVDSPAIGINTEGTTVPLTYQGSAPIYFPELAVESASGPCAEKGCFLSVTNSAADNNCRVALFPGTCFNGLSVIVPSSKLNTTDSSATALQGSILSFGGGTIFAVQTFLTYCAQTITCDVPSGNTVGSQVIQANTVAFTGYTLPTPVQVAAGQSVNISVTISFGSGSPASASTTAVPVHRATPLVASTSSTVSRP